MPYLYLPRSIRSLVLLGVIALTIGSTATPSHARRRRPKPIAPAPITTPVAPRPNTNIDNQSLERAVHEQINRYRADQGLNALTWNDAIATQARQHSANMANGQTGFGHDGFQSRVQGTGLDYQGAAENVAYNQGSSDPVTVAVKGWIASPGHLKNIKGNYETAGIGIAQNAKGEIYFTQVFIRSR
jgi:uncharacterized protein YkwD